MEIALSAVALHDPSYHAAGNSLGDLTIEVREIHVS